MDILDYIPWDKSWIMRMGILDLVHDKADTRSFLASNEHLSDDLIALERALEAWEQGKPIDVGESGTLYRFLRFAAWRFGLSLEFIRQGTLRQRAITDDPSIVGLAQEQLLALDNGTSQWASAAALLGDSHRVAEPPFKLALTYEAIAHWNERRALGLSWEPRRDATIWLQAQAFARLRANGAPEFTPRQAEDFCFAVCFCHMSVAEGERQWPSLRGHESDRVVEIDRSLREASAGKIVSSRDHRVVQAVAMWGRLRDIPVRFASPQSVAKSWPRFWEFLTRV